MSHALSVLEFLDDIRPSGRCDDCLSDELDIRPRQNINIVCRPLHEAGKIERFKAACPRCGKTKLINTLVDPVRFGTVSIGQAARSPSPNPTPRPVAAAAAPTSVTPLDVEKIRTGIVHICKTVWRETQTEEAPRSIAAIIIQLRTSSAIPNHQANMMLTLCNLRNSHVYEDYPLGPHEMAIAMNAAAIVEDWWLGRASAGNAPKKVG
jgi:hypothetical protein